MFGFLKNLGPTEIIILSLIFVVLFGAKAFKSIAKTAGESFREMKNIKKNFSEAVDDGDKKSKD